MENDLIIKRDKLINKVNKSKPKSDRRKKAYKDLMAVEKEILENDRC